MKEYIEKEKLFDCLDIKNALGGHYGISLTAINAIPAADVVEVRHGRWVHGREVGREYLGDCLVGIFYDRWTCSECGYVVDDHEYSGINYKFCPNCGARMDGGVNRLEIDTVKNGGVNDAAD